MSEDARSEDVAPEGVPWHRRLRDSPLGSVLVLAVTALVVLGGVWLVGVLRGDDGVSSVELAFDADPVEIGQPAPGFTAKTVDGQQISLEDLRGRPVWLLFGATWCANCRAEAPDVQAVHEARDDVVIVAVYVGEGTKTVSGYAEEAGLTYQQIADPDTRLGSTYRARALPRHVLVDADGIVRRIDVGGVDRATADARLDELSAR
ncbi:MAG: TlpA family protein disulfide reductase [Micrococcales bacterium]|nr:TlpA family protein disulfide reductase [Micrococcales bacterium]